MRDNDYYELLRKDIVAMILGCPGVVRYEPNQLIEVKPGRKSPIHINFKNTLGDIILREKIAESLANAMRSSGINYVCGVESGGSYFASRCADILGVPMSLFRKSYKEYAEKGFLVGPDPDRGCTIAVLDDTLVTGTTIRPIVAHLQESSPSVHVYCILSYGLDAQVKRRMSPSSISSIFGISDLIERGVDEGRFLPEVRTFIQRFVDEHTEKAEIQ